MNINKVQAQPRATGLYALRGSVWPGHSAALHSHATLHPQFVGPGNAPYFLIRAAKPSYTAGTLCAIKPEIYGMPRIHAGQRENKWMLCLIKQERNNYGIFCGKKRRFDEYSRII
jgi:hypothetical protein